MDPHKSFLDERHSGYCGFCGGISDTRELLRLLSARTICSASPGRNGGTFRQVMLLETMVLPGKSNPHVPGDDRQNNKDQIRRVPEECVTTLKHIRRRP